ncbi:C40 family peptidase [Pseudoclavibacter sp. VKM Ac-2867]|nr:C40 family peptidase [Pseudoclavibacter sp. VKM Ac-2867]
MSYVGSYFGSCDLLTQAAYAAVGISLPRGVSAQAAMGTPTSNPQPGDLVVWPGEHIGIYAGNGMVIDDPGYGGRSVQYRSISWGSPYYVSLR